MEDRRPTISVVVPVYNGSRTIRQLASETATALSQLTDSWELILVDDGSPDDSWSVIEQLAQEMPEVTSIRLNRNYGQHNALLCGIRHAAKAVIVTMDDDLQNPPAEIGKLLDGLTDDVDVVYGVPAQQEHGLWRNFASSVTKLGLRSAMGVSIARDVSAFRAFRSRVTPAFAGFGGNYVSLDVLLTWGTTRFSSVIVDHHPRAEGVSNYTLGKLIVHAINMAAGFTTWPLRLASFIGFAFTLLGFGVLAEVLGRFALTGHSIPGFPFLASAIAIFSGAQLFALGIIGEYLARIYARSMDRPTYAIWQTTAGGDDAHD